MTMCMRFFYHMTFERVPIYLAAGHGTQVIYNMIV